MPPTLDIVEARPLLSYRPWESRVALPSAAEIEALGDEYMPYAFAVFDSASMVDGGLVGAQQVGNGYVSQPEECYVTHLVGSAVNSDGTAGNFVLQIYDVQRQALWTPQPLNFSNMLGTAKKPFWLKHLYPLPAGGQLECQVTNLSATLSCSIQVVCWGVRR